jgi:hypothetical protein
MQMAMVWTMFNDLGQDCQGLWNCWRNGQWCSKIDSVGGAAQSLSTWRILKNMMLLLLQTDRFLHLQATLLKSARLHPHWGQQLARSQGWMVSLHKNLFIRNSLEGRERKLDGAAKTVGRLCAHFVCLPPFMPANFKGQQAEAKVCTIVCATQNLEAQGVVYSAL